MSPIQCECGRITYGEACLACARKLPEGSSIPAEGERHRDGVKDAPGSSQALPRPCTMKTGKINRILTAREAKLKKVFQPIRYFPESNNF